MNRYGKNAKFKIKSFEYPCYLCSFKQILRKKTSIPVFNSQILFSNSDNQYWKSFIRVQTVLLPGNSTKTIFRIAKHIDNTDKLFENDISIDIKLYEYVRIYRIFSYR